MEYRSRRDSTMPTLLPFMAVLLCTMGALVLILLLIVSDTKGTVRKELIAESEQLELDSDEMYLVSQEFEAMRERLQSEIERSRQQLAFLENHITRIETETHSYEGRLERIQGAGDSDEKSLDADAIAALQTDIEELERKINSEKADANSREQSYAIIPYGGPQGTTRRPIYLECVADGVIVQPEGFLLEMEALRPPHGPGNPLNSVLRMLRTEYQKLDEDASLSCSPYPLLLIRPDGIESYVFARAAMGGWDDQFGYELVGSDMKLAFPPNRMQLKAQIEQTVALAMSRQRALIAAMPRVYSRPQNWDDFDVHSEGGRENSDRLHRSSQNDSISPNDNWNIIYESDGPPSDSSKALTGFDTQRGSGTGRHSVPNGSKPFSDNEVEELLAQDSSAPDWNDPAAANSSGLRSDPLARGDNAQGPEGNGYGSESVTHSSDENLTSANPGSRGNGQAPSQGPGQNQSQNQSQFGNNDPTSDAQNPQVNNSLQTSNEKLESSRFNRDSVAQGSNSRTNTVSHTKQRESSRNGKSDSKQGSNSIAKNRQSSKRMSNASPAGSEWKYSRHAQNLSPVTREIHIHVMPDQWLIASDANINQIENVLQLDSGPKATNDQLTKVIDSKVEGWGPAMDNGYWQPKFITHSYNSSESSIDRLRWLLKQNHIESVEATAGDVPNQGNR